MRHFSRQFWAPLVLAAHCLLPAGAAAADKLPITASFSILGDLVQTVGGDRVTVTTLVGANEDAHVFEPKPADAKNLLQAKVLVVNGLGFEPWVQKLAKSAGYKGITVTASQGVKARQMSAQKGDKHKHHDDTDPHAWQNPIHVITYVRNISAALSHADPAGAATYQRNTDAYVKELQALDQWAQAQLAPLAKEQRKVITSHDAFGYFAVQYQVSFLAPQGVATNSEPSAKGVASLIRQIQRDKVKAVFVENMSNPKLLVQLAKDTGVTVGPTLYVDALSGPNEPGATYLKMMTHNVTQLVNGMRQN
jgi:zinc/manganese transport system substrate-binding protein